MFIIEPVMYKENAAIKMLENELLAIDIAFLLCDIDLLSLNLALILILNNHQMPSYTQ